MDGTLTEPRQLFDTKLLSPLRKLSQFADIGIVTGSDYDYLTEQMKTLIRFSELRYVTHLLPCNGTKYYKPPSYSDDEHKLVHEVNMESHLGSECFRQIIMLLCAAQEEMCYYGFPLTGHFISYRGSTINWSPVGRNATTAQRNKFIEIDNSHKPSLRGRELSKISHKINMRCRKEVAIKIGGETSFDIFQKAGIRLMLCLIFMIKGAGLLETERNLAVTIMKSISTYCSMVALFILMDRQKQS